MRRCVVADPGYKLFSIDYSQAESFIMGGLALRDGRDRAYLDACKSGDLHTAVTKEIWPDLGWTGDKDGDRNIAEQPFYFALSYRDTEKRLGHGSNYLGSAPHLAKITRTDKDSVINFQLRYFKKFPGIKMYHNKQIARIQTDRRVETSFGRHRTFFGHPNDSATHRKAIAFDPQSTVGDMLNLGLWLVWEELDEWGPSKGPLQLLLQVHDNIVFQLPDNPEDPQNALKQRKVIERVLELLTIEFTYGDEVFSIPVEVECGWNWAPKKADKSNADGLIPWNPEGEARLRVFTPSLARLD
jgi:DNA polymerase I-like protein with 3'-5' exonuclease and polymerase domains